ncbi:MAG: GNAT family N-acetyltransferase [Steroidobacterales bacterium]
MTQATDVHIAPATPDDVPLILGLIRELAVYEKLEDQVSATEAVLRESLFGPASGAQALVASVGGEPAAFALYFHNFSTFLGRRGLYLEDLFVRPAFRGRGVGKALLVHLAGVALARGCGRFDWQVLDWNRSARDFYESLGAVPVAGWVNYRVTGDALRRLALGEA